MTQHQENNMPWPTVLMSYRMDGSEWGFEITAKDLEDAQRRLAAIAMTGKVDGILAENADAKSTKWLPWTLRLHMFLARLGWVRQ